MQLGRVIGTVVATTRAPGLDGIKLLIVQPLDKHGRAAGRAVVAADAVAMAGPGEMVYVVAAREVSIVVGAALGAFALRERHPVARITGAAIIFAGLVVLALA